MRPDFGVLVDGRFVGWVELKAPGTGTDPLTWSGRNRQQWQRLAELDNLLLCDGERLQLYRQGAAESDAVDLPYHQDDIDLEGVVKLLRRFKSGRPAPIRSARDLAHALAPLARDLRLRIAAGLAPKTRAQPVQRARDIWRDLLHEEVTDERFADALAQVIAYSLVIATLDGEGDADEDGVVTLEEAEHTLTATHRVLAATLRPVLDVRGLRGVLRSEVGALERLLGVVDAKAIARRKDPRGDPWLWFYEDFLAAYDPEARRNTGVYYTPVQVVSCITKLVDHVLVERFGLQLGFADESVVTLDPAVGTGTFPLSVLDRAAVRAEEVRGKAGPSQVANGLAERLYGFELLPGPFAVAHLRVGERLQELGATLPPGGAQILLADTLETPSEDPAVSQLELFGPAEVLSEERRRARRVKREQRVMAIVGNPPWDRVRKEDTGGWVVHGDDDGKGAIFDQLVKVANERTIFSHVASLYNLYAYFLRWAIWKAFEHHGEGPAVIGMITASSWLDGPGFVGLRELVRELCDEVWIVDLGGDNRGARPEENVFAIESPVAIAVLIRHADGPDRPGEIRYRRIHGSSTEKLAALDQVQPPDLDESAWETIESEEWGLFVPEPEEGAWTAMPAVGDLFPWRQPGCQMNRTWPIAPDADTLERRWNAFLADRSAERRGELFPNPSSGRSVSTKVGQLPSLSELPPNAAVPPVAGYGWRPFDRQWALEDPRLAKTESPALWQTRSQSQIFLVLPSVSLAPGPGPTVHCFTEVPDRNSFKGSASASIVALYRDAAATQPNVTQGVLEAIGAELRQRDPEAEDPTPEHLAAYVYALLSTPAYQARFEDELEGKVVRVPLSADPPLWEAAVALGSELIRLHAFGERFSGSATRSSRAQPSWDSAVTALPEDQTALAYDEDRRQLRIGDGAVSHVPAEVWDYTVSGYPVVRRWLEHRTKRGRGRGRHTSELDDIRPAGWNDSWNDELLDLLRALAASCELRPEQDELLARICDGPLIAASSLPEPDEEERAVPPTERSGTQADQLSTDL
ncbi:MAG TPA: type ISP restriction/modification enzyme [Solirubrobacterales bacterium]|nr:type ISP restriction/modification enzyme [Solirubrobacterales bacterium]